MPTAVDAALSDTVRSSRRAAGQAAASPQPLPPRTQASPAPESRPAPAAVAVELSSSALDGRYEVLRKVGEGGMSAVFEARHTVLGKRVAIKVLLDKYVAKPDVVARLLQEGRLASAIGHENIVDITDFGETSDGRTFVVMEFLEGESLHDLLLREGCLPPSRAIPIARQVASALGAAHEKGIIHRDVKPENVFIIRRGERDFVKVVDFGISKALKQAEDGTSSPRLTTTGMILGTPLYLSPEQARGEEDLDHGVDIYALGVVLYEALTGEVPFHGANYLSIISQIIEKEARPPSELRPDLGLSADVDAVVARAMAKDRTVRYPTMAELDADLARLAGGLAPRARTVQPIGEVARRRWPQIAGWVVGIAAIGLAVAMVLPRLFSEEESKPPLTLAQPEATPQAPAQLPPAPAPSPPPPTPAVAKVTIRSEPPGAEIWWASVLKGTTPKVLELPRGDDAVELVLRLDGYDDAPVKFYPTGDVEVPVTLRAKSPPRSAKRPPARPKPEPDRGPTSGGEIKPSPYAK